MSIDNERGIAVTSRLSYTFGGGLVYRYDLGEQFIESGLYYNYVDGVNWQEFDPEKYPTNLTAISIRSVHYVNVPVTFNFRFGDGLTAGAGASAGFAVFENYAFVAQSELFADYRYYNEQTAERFDFGLNGQFGYELTKKITVQCKGYLGLQNIGADIEETLMSATYEVEKVNRSQRNRQLTIGLKYVF